MEIFYAGGLILGECRCVPPHSTLDPISHNLNLRIRELTLWRHVRIGIGEQNFGQQTGFLISGFNDGPRVAAFQQRFP